MFAFTGTSRCEGTVQDGDAFWLLGGDVAPCLQLLEKTTQLCVKHWAACPQVNPNATLRQGFAVGTVMAP